jgi:hypothetical protein
MGAADLGEPFGVFEFTGKLSDNHFNIPINAISVKEAGYAKKPVIIQKILRQLHLLNCPIS